MVRNTTPRWGPRSGAMPRAITPITSAYTTPMGSSYPTPLASAYASAYTSEAELDNEGDAVTADGELEEATNSLAALTMDTPLRPFRRERKVPRTPFHFLSLPSELRIKIYEYFFDNAEDIIDLGPENYKRTHKKLGFMRTCRQIHAEATHFFYGTRTFRLFPTYPGKHFKSKKPMLARLKPIQRQCITSLELRLGPGWNAPPRGWVVNDALGLTECISLRTLTVFVECDPSDAYFKGFRRSDGFYEAFCRRLLADVVKALPEVQTIQFDAWNSVKKSGAMMRSLMEVAAQLNMEIAWGPERGWTDADEPDEQGQAVLQAQTSEDGTQFVDIAVPPDVFANNIVAVA